MLNISGQLPKYAVVAVVLAGLIFAVTKFFDGGGEGLRVDVRVPELSVLALQGKGAFDASCAKCHGPNGSGTGKGPPLIHRIYEPGHHGDQAFVIAAKRGVRRHHWPYGNMPAQPQVSGAQIAVIIKYVREIQAANGIN